MILQDAIWVPLTCWHSAFGDLPDHPAAASQRNHERDLLTPDGVHYHVTAPYQAVWLTVRHAIADQPPEDHPAIPGITHQPESIHQIAVSPNGPYVDCRGNVLTLQNRALEILDHLGIDADSYHIGSRPVPGARYDAIQCDIFRQLPKRESPQRPRPTPPTRTLYHQTQELAMSAEKAHRRGERESAQEFYRQALQLSLSSLADYTGQLPFSPNYARYAIASDAGWYAIKANLPEVAIQMAHLAGQSAMDLNASIPQTDDDDPKDAKPLLCGNPADIFNSAAAAIAANQGHPPPRLAVDLDWLKSFLTTCAEQGQLDDDYIKAFDDRRWQQLADFIIHSIVQDDCLIDIIAEYATKFQDAGYVTYRPGKQDE